MVPIEPYLPTVAVLGATAVLLLIQLLVADVIAIRRKHPPGHAVEPDFQDILFRASRAFANTNESIGLFMLAVLFAIFVSAEPAWTNLGAMIYLVGRVGHMTCYYLNKALLRSLSFALSLLGVVIILSAGIAHWF